MLSRFERPAQDSCWRSAYEATHLQCHDTPTGFARAGAALVVPRGGPAPLVWKSGKIDTDTALAAYGCHNYSAGGLQAYGPGPRCGIPYCLGVTSPGTL